MSPNDLLNLELKAKSSGLDWHDFRALIQHCEDIRTRVEEISPDDLEAEIYSLECENERLQEENRELQDRIDDLEEEKLFLSEEIGDLNNEIFSLEARLG